jgi:hypothetical protein
MLVGIFLSELLLDTAAMLFRVIHRSHENGLRYSLTAILDLQITAIVCERSKLLT